MLIVHLLLPQSHRCYALEGTSCSVRQPPVANSLGSTLFSPHSDAVPITFIVVVGLCSGFFMMISYGLCSGCISTLCPKVYQGNCSIPKSTASDSFSIRAYLLSVSVRALTRDAGTAVFASVLLLGCLLRHHTVVLAVPQGCSTLGWVPNLQFSFFFQIPVLGSLTIPILHHGVLIVSRFHRILICLCRIWKDSWPSLLITEFPSHHLAWAFPLWL